MNAVDENGCTPLAVAVLVNKLEMIKLLLQHKDIPVNTKINYYYTTLHYDARFGYAECVQILLKHKEINEHLLNSQHRTALDKALQNGHIDSIKLFLRVDK